MKPRPLSVAWHEALYGESGFYRRSVGPAGHFATSAQGIPRVAEVYAEALLALTAHLGAAHLVDLGAGRGELLRLLHARSPELKLTSVDVVERPAQLPTDIEWIQSPGGSDLPAFESGTDTLVVANEWLDVVPCTVTEWDGSRWRVVQEDDSLGAEPTGPERGWQEQWWPSPAPTPGDRIEIGLARDLAFAALRDRAPAAALLIVDYGHLREDRPTTGTVIGYRDGTAVAPAFDGTTDVTAHVAMDSLGADDLIKQRDALPWLGIRAEAPSLDLARTAPADYLAGLARRTAVATARDPGGLGAFWWALSYPPGAREKPPR